MKKVKYHWTIQAQEWESQCSFDRRQIKDAFLWFDDHLDANGYSMQKSEKVIFVWSCIQIAQVTHLDLPVVLRRVIDSLVIKLMPDVQVKCNNDDCSQIISWTVPGGFCASCQINGRTLDLEKLNKQQEGLDEDVLNKDYPIEKVEEDLREAGFDPDEVGKKGAALAKKLIKEREEKT